MAININFPASVGCQVRVCVLVVTYRPNLVVLEKLVASLSTDVEKIFIFDNSEIEFFSNNLTNGPVPEIEIFHANENLGIASAQNRLLQSALQEGFDLAVMSDQDTIYPHDFINELSKYCFIKENIVAVCPGWLDTNLQGKERYPGQYVFDSKGRLYIDLSENSILKIAHAISSGMIINLHNLNRIGLMREDLFIDWVDNEWCWRAHTLNMLVLAIPAVKVKHTLGDSTVRVCGKNFVKRNKERNYYIIRNALYLSLFSSVPFGAKTYLVKKVFHHTMFSFIASDNKLNELIYIAKAWLHGLLGRLGRIS